MAKGCGMQKQSYSDAARAMCGPVSNAASPDWMKVLHLGFIREYPRGTTVKRPGDDVDHIFLVLRGEIHINNFLAAEDSVPVMFARENALVGLIPFFTSGKCESYWEAVHDSALCLFSREVVQERLPRPLLMNMLEHMGWRARNTTNRACGQAAYNVERRLAELLLHLLATCRPIRCSGADACVRPCVYQGELSKILGIHRVHFSRLLTFWRKHGVLGKLTKNMLEVKNLALLTALAEGTVKLYARERKQA